MKLLLDPAVANFTLPSFSSLCYRNTSPNQHIFRCLSRVVYIHAKQATLSNGAAKTLQSRSFLHVFIVVLNLEIYIL